jgi:hypothetical protein
MATIFAACKKFDPHCGNRWSDYLDWSGFHHLQELVSIDTILCPSLIEELIDEDWNFNIHADFRTDFFHDHEYLRRRVNYDSSRHNILALTEHPTHTPVLPDGFSHCGYDILDEWISNSVLTNCGEFSSIYTADDLNHFGLVDDLSRVKRIAKTIRKAHPNDDHCCDCRVWGIARYVGNI